MGNLFIVFSLLIFLNVYSFGFDKNINQQHEKLNLTQDEITYIKEKKTILVSNELDYEPYDFNKKGQALGYSIDLLNVLLKDTGLKIKYITKPWSKLLEDLDNQKIDLIHTIFKTEDREKKYIFSTGYSQVIQSYVLRNNAEDIDDIKQLYGKNIGITKGWQEEEFFNKFPEIKRIYLNGVKEKLDALSNGKIDAFIDHINVSSYYIKKFGYSNLKISKPVKEFSIIQLHRYYFAALKNNPHLISILNKSYNHLSINKIDELNKKWFGNIKSSFLSLTNEEKEYLNKNNKFKVCIQNDFYPYSAVIDNKFSGIMGEYFEEISRITNIDFTPVKIDSLEHLNILEKQSECDIISSIEVDNPNFKNTFATKAFIDLDYSLISSTHSLPIDDIHFSNEDILYYVKYPEQQKNINKIYPSFRIKVNPNVEDIIKIVKSNTNVIFLSPKLQANQIISKYGYEDLKENGFLDVDTHRAIGVKKDLTLLLNILNKSIDFLETKNTYDSVRKIYWPTEYKVQSDYKYFWYSLVILSIVILALFYRQRLLKKKNQEIENEKNSFQLLLKNAVDGIHILDMKGNIVECSDSFADMLGFTKDEVLKLNVDDFDVVIPKEKQEILINNFTDNLETFETKHKRKDGSIYDAQVIVKSIKLYNKTYVYASVRDITEQKILTKKINDLNENLELKVQEKTKELSELNKDLERKVALEVQKNIKKEILLLEQQKHAQMGSMIANISHQMKQPLSLISTIASGIKINYEHKIPQDEITIIENMNLIIERTQYLSETINTFRNFLKESKEFKEVVLQNRIEVALNIVNISLKDNGIKLIDNVDYKNEIKIKIIIGELAQVIINIINNSKDILLENKIKNPWIKIDLESDKEMVKISIEDNAGGIPNNVLPYIFDEYFTTKDDEKGTGLGLYMSKKIIEKSLKGHLSVENTVNGAKFTIQLPLNI